MKGGGQPIKNLNEVTAIGNWAQSHRGPRNSPQKTHPSGAELPGGPQGPDSEVVRRKLSQLPGISKSYHGGHCSPPQHGNLEVGQGVGGGAHIASASGLMSTS